jgi:hypothetical protein
MDHTLDVNNTAAQEPQQPECLVAYVTNLLASNGHPTPEAWLRLLKPGMAGFPDPDYQAYEINRAWRNAFAETIGKNILSTEESMDVRYSLIDKCPVANWKTAFEQGALPCIIKHQLPISN